MKIHPTTHQLQFLFNITTIFIILILNPIHATIGLSSVIQPTYNVAKGDIMKYRYTVTNYENKDYIPYNIILKNGTDINVNLTVGTILTIKVTAINTSINGYHDIFIQANLSIPGSGLYTEQEQYGQRYINYAFNNKTMVDLYAKENTNASNFYFLSTNNNYLILKDNYTDSQVKDDFEAVYNWHTGWLQNLKIINKDKNNTKFITVSDMRLERISNDQTSSILNYLVLVSLIASPLLPISILVYSWWDYKKKSEVNNKLSTTKGYFIYIKENLKKKKKKNKKDNINILLDEVQEIIHDSEKEKERSN